MPKQRYPIMYNRTQAARIVTIFEQFVREDEMRGGGHPDLMDWHHERYLIARERMIRRLIGDPQSTEYMPLKPEYRR